MKQKKILTFLFSIISFFICCISLSGQIKQAIIKLDIEREIGNIDTMIYGSFTEHLGRCIYGGLYEPGSSLSGEDGFRKDVINVVKQLNIRVVRWPGGNFVSGYHWEDGIGDINSRPVRLDLAWGAKEDNSFGTDEFIDWCRAVNTEPFICVNLGTGTLDEARNWVEYCNFEKGTYYSNLRIKNGHTTPHKVIYWGLGNEMDGSWQMGHKNADDYGKYALEAAKLMKWVDKDIKLIAAGSSNYSSDWIGWNRTVLDYLGDHMDYISLHHYARNRENDYYKYMASLQFAEKVIKITEGLIQEEMSKSKRKNSIYIAFDEYNVWYRSTVQNDLEEKYNLEDALVIATYLNMFVRNAQIVKMSNMAQLVNVIAPIFTTEGGLFYQTIFYPLQLFANNCKGVAINAYVDCDTYQINNEEVPYLDVSSAYNKEENEVVINVVNRHKDSPVITEIVSQNGTFEGKAIVYEVNGKTIKDENSMDRQLVKTKTNEVNVNGEQFTYNFPAHSFTTIILPIKVN